MYGNGNIYLVNKQKWRSNRTMDKFHRSTGTIATLWLWKETVNSWKQINIYILLFRYISYHLFTTIIIIIIDYIVAYIYIYIRVHIPK